MKRIAIGSTRAGLTLKEGIISHLQEKGFDVDDLGMKRDGDFVPYYQSAANVAGAVSQGEYEQAIIICGTGAGSVIVANKFKGVHAVFTSSEFEAHQAKAVNDANVICFGEWITPVTHAVKIVDKWLATPFGDGIAKDWVNFLREAVDGVKEIEKENFK